VFTDKESRVTCCELTSYRRKDVLLCCSSKDKGSRFEVGGENGEGTVE
jgi:hypothetical protein